MGYPTANVRIKNYELGIRNGVYSAIITENNHQHMAAAIVGMWQEASGPSVEVHLLNFSGDLLGQTVTVELGKFLRPLKKFTNNEELVEQIKKDLKELDPGSSPG